MLSAVCFAVFGVLMCRSLTAQETVDDPSTPTPDAATEHPDPWQEVHLLVGDEGQDAEVSCQELESPITWTKHDPPGPLPDGSTVVGDTLLFRKLRAEDSAMYQCIIANDAEDAVPRFVQLMVRPANWTNSTETTLVVTGPDTTSSASAESSPISTSDTTPLDTPETTSPAASTETIIPNPTTEYKPQDSTSAVRDGLEERPSTTFTSSDEPTSESTVPPDTTRTPTDLPETSPTGTGQSGLSSSPAVGTQKTTATSSSAVTGTTKNMQSPLLVVSSIIEEPFLMLKTVQPNASEPAGNCRFEGYIVDLLEELRKLVNFSYEIRLVKDSAYGAPNDHGRWNGMIGELVRKEVDLAVAPLTITYARMKVVDFTKPFMNTGISLVMKKSNKSVPGIFSFTEPFSPGTWLAIGCAYLGISGIIFLVNRFNSGRARARDDEEDPSTCWRLCHSTGKRSKNRCGHRLVRIVGWIFTVAVTSVYIASLAASFVVERMKPEQPDLPIRGVEELLRQTDIRYGVVAGGSTIAFFRNSQAKPYRDMWQEISQRTDVIVSSASEGFARVRSSGGRYAFLAETPLIDYENNRAPCDTVKIGEDLDAKGYGIATQPGSVWTERLSHAILLLQERGFLQQLRDRWWREQSNFQCSSGSSDRHDSSDKHQLKLRHVAGLFFILVIGLVFSLIMALLEYLCTARISRRRGDYDVAMS